MSPTLNRETIDVLEILEQDRGAKVVVLTGCGESWSEGMDLKEYFCEIDADLKSSGRESDAIARRGSGGSSAFYATPTIAMVNGWCFGGAFSPLVAFDLAIAAEEATFGVSEINWGIPPVNLVSKTMADTVGHRRALYLIMTGDTFDGTQAAQMGLVNEAVPLARLRDRTAELSRRLAERMRVFCAPQNTVSNVVAS